MYSSGFSYVMFNALSIWKNVGMTVYQTKQKIRASRTTNFVDFKGPHLRQSGWDHQMTKPLLHKDSQKLSLKEHTQEETNQKQGGLPLHQCSQRTSKQTK